MKRVNMLAAVPVTVYSPRSTPTSANSATAGKNLGNQGILGLFSGHSGLSVEHGTILWINRRVFFWIKICLVNRALRNLDFLGFNLVPDF